MSIQWVPGSGSSVPSNAVPGGVDRGTRLYVARASHAGSLVPGKLHPTYKNVYVSYGGNEHAKGSGYEILTGEGFQWKAAENGRVPQGAVQGGREANGTPLYVARAKVDGVDSIGKVRHQSQFLLPSLWWEGALSKAIRGAGPRPTHLPPLEQEPNHQVCQGGACSALLLEQLQLEQLLQLSQA